MKIWCSDRVSLTRGLCWVLFEISKEHMYRVMNFKLFSTHLSNSRYAVD